MKNPTFALIIIILVVTAEGVYLYNINQGYWWDEAVYLGLARNIYQGNGYWINEPGTESFRAPLFPHLIAGAWAFTGVSEGIAKAIPVLFGLLSVIMSYFVARKVLSKEAGIITAALMATSSLFLFFEARALAETLFIFLALCFIYVHYSAITGGKAQYYVLSGIIMSLAFLARYPGLILWVVYLVSPLALKKSKVSMKGFAIGLALAVALLVPWIMIAQQYYGSPVGALAYQAGTVGGQYYPGGWDFYFANWLEAFGVAGLFAVPGIAYALKRKKRGDAYLLLMFLISLLFFILLPRKEVRYLLNYFPVYLMVVSIGVACMVNSVKCKRAALVLVSLLLAAGLFAGLANVNNNAEAGSALKEAGLWLKGNAPPGEAIMSQNYPVLYYTSGRTVFPLPVDAEALHKEAAENNIRYIAIDTSEPTFPDYVFGGGGEPSKIFGESSLVKTFEEYGKTAVWIYKTGAK
ncbi:MAG: glycosyltransferase family 39 protein [Candidatus Aenigmarchaeota archaeon]|nr:glycosyltransferase family 39 protein [Candidatus Aenigmarchaeota archaeon]